MNERLQIPSLLAKIYPKKVYIPNCPPHLRADLAAYRKKVNAIVRKIPPVTINGYKGGLKDHCIDHKVSVFYGFLHDLSPEEICVTSNLRWTTKEENNRKRLSCIFEDTELLIDEKDRSLWSIDA